jgi:hypothetical protein
MLRSAMACLIVRMHLHPFWIPPVPETLHKLKVRGTYPHPAHTMGAQLRHPARSAQSNSSGASLPTYCTHSGSTAQTHPHPFEGALHSVLGPLQQQHTPF